MINKTIFLPTLLSLCILCNSQKLPNITEAKKQIHEHYESGAFDQEVEDILKNAWKNLKTIKPEENSVVIIDIDETALSHYAYFKMMQFAKEESSFIKWKALELSPAIAPVLRFYRRLVDHGFKVIFVSCRSEFLRESTISNLKKVGYTYFERVILRTPEDKILPFWQYKKQTRAKLAKEGWDIVACIGDQWSDLKGNNTGIKIKIPNYILSE